MNDFRIVGRCPTDLRIETSGTSQLSDEAGATRDTEAVNNHPRAEDDEMAWDLKWTSW